MPIDRVVQPVGVEVLEHLPRALLEVRRGDDRPVLLGRQPRLDRLAVRRLRDEREEPVALVGDDAREDDLAPPALAVLRDDVADRLVPPLVAAGRLEDRRDVLDDRLEAERVGDLGADVERVRIRVRLRHEQRERPLRAEGVRAQARRHRAVHAARDADDGASAVELARHDPAQRLSDLVRDALRVDRQSVRCDPVHRQAAWPVVLPLDEVDDVVDRVEVLRKELLVRDPDVELLLEEADELEHSRRVDQAGLDQRARAGELGRVVPQEVVGGEEFAQIALNGLVTRGITRHDNDFRTALPCSLEGVEYPQSSAY